MPAGTPRRKTLFVSELFTPGVVLLTDQYPDTLVHMEQLNLLPGSSASVTLYLRVTVLVYRVEVVELVEEGEDVVVLVVVVVADRRVVVVEVDGAVVVVVVDVVVVPGPPHTEE